MKKVIALVLIGMIFAPTLFADDGEYDMQMELPGAQEVKQVRDEKNEPASVKDISAECNELKNNLKNAGAALSQAYEANNPKEIRKQEFKVWYIKQKIALKEKSKDFAYLLAELQKMSNEYPSSAELKTLISQTEQEIGEYLKNGTQIIDIEAKQRKLDDKLSRVQKAGLIIRQKEILKKMQRDYNNS